MRKIVLDTNCLLISLPKISPYRIVWDAFLRGSYQLFFHPIEEESESPCKENPFGIHRQKKAGVSLNLSMLFPSVGLKRFEIGIVVKTIK